MKNSKAGLIRLSYRSRLTKNNKDLLHPEGLVDSSWRDFSQARADNLKVEWTD